MGKKILIIEDNAELRENTAELLDVAGYEVATAKNGKEGVERAKEFLPDLVLCDVMMPILDGYGVLRAFENIPEVIGTPFVFLTAKAEREDFRKGMDLGADDYLTKPFSGDDLLNVVSARLKKSRFLKEITELNIPTSDNNKGIETLFENVHSKKLRKKDTLFMEGDYSNFLFFITSGKIKIFKSNEHGKEYIIDIYKEGDFIGYSDLLDDSQYKVSATALEDCELSLIPKEKFLKLIESDSETAFTFVKMVSHNFQEASEKLLKLAYDSARKRVAEAILFISRKYQQKGKDGLSFSILRENISALSGISPESVSRNLTNFKDEGLIEMINGSIKILNQKKLETLKN